MPRISGKYLVSETLARSLQEHNTWQVAHDAAVVFFENLLALANSANLRIMLENFQRFHPETIDFLERFLSSGHCMRATGMSGTIFLEECYDDPSVMLEIKLEVPDNSQFGMDVIFNKAGTIVHAGF